MGEHVETSGEQWAWREGEVAGTLHMAGGNANLESSLAVCNNTVFKNLNMYILYDSAIPLLGI